MKLVSINNIQNQNYTELVISQRLLNIKEYLIHTINHNLIDISHDILKDSETSVLNTYDFTFDIYGQNYDSIKQLTQGEKIVIDQQIKKMGMDNGWKINLDNLLFEGGRTCNVNMDLAGLRDRNIDYVLKENRNDYEKDSSSV